MDVRLCSNKFFRMILAYNHNLADYAFLKSLLKSISNVLKNNKNYMILGDFNLRNFNWENFLSNTSKQDRIFVNFLTNMHPIYQIVNFPTRNQNTLDIILTNNPKLIEDLDPTPNIKNSDHICITGRINLRVSTTIKKGFYMKDFSKVNIESCSNFLNSVCPELCDDQTVDSYYQKFCDLLNYVQSNYIPEKRFNTYKNEILPKNTFKVYKSFNKCYKKWKSTNKNYYFLKYKFLKENYSRMLKNKRLCEEANLVLNKNYTKCFRFFNAKVNNKQIEKTFIDLDGKILLDPKIICNAFNNYFSSIYELSKHSPFTFQNSENDSIVISMILIKTSIKELRLSRGSGADGIPMSFWVSFMEPITPILYKLFNHIANTGN